MAAILTFSLTPVTPSASFPPSSPSYSMETAEPMTFSSISCRFHLFRLFWLLAKTSLSFGKCSKRIQSSLERINVQMLSVSFDQHVVSHTKCVKRVDCQWKSVVDLRFIILLHNIFDTKQAKHCHKIG